MQDLLSTGTACGGIPVAFGKPRSVSTVDITPLLREIWAASKERAKKKGTAACVANRRQCDVWKQRDQVDGLLLHVDEFVPGRVSGEASTEPLLN